MFTLAHRGLEFSRPIHNEVSEVCMRTTSPLMIAFALLMFAGALTPPSKAGPFEDGVEAFNRGEYSTALKTWQAIADQGHPYAQANIGLAYALGQGVSQDFKIAMKWYRMAADQGVATAQHNLGIMYLHGQGMPQQDHTNAIRWFLKAAEHGKTDFGHVVLSRRMSEDERLAVAASRFQLGLMHWQGQAVPQDYAEAASWFQKASNQGYGKAQVNLGAMYFNGQGVPQDYVQALKWLTLGAAIIPPGTDRDSVIKSRDEVAAKLTPAQATEVQRLVREWKPE